MRMWSTRSRPSWRSGCGSRWARRGGREDPARSRDRLRQDRAHNLELLRRLDELRRLAAAGDRHLAQGLSRAVWRASRAPRRGAERLAGTIATNVLALERGASVFRVHDVGPVRDALAVTAATLGERWTARSRGRRRGARRRRSGPRRGSRRVGASRSRSRSRGCPCTPITGSARPSGRSGSGWCWTCAWTSGRPTPR